MGSNLEYLAKIEPKIFDPLGTGSKASELRASQIYAKRKALELDAKEQLDKERDWFNDFKQ